MQVIRDGSIKQFRTEGPAPPGIDFSENKIIFTCTGPDDEVLWVVRGQKGHHQRVAHRLDGRVQRADNSPIAGRFTSDGDLVIRPNDIGLYLNDFFVVRPSGEEP